MHNFKQLTVWQKSIDLTIKVYSVLSAFPTDEKYGLSSQIKRSTKNDLQFREINKNYELIIKSIIK